jgi:uncharacterized protein (TIGR02246 family)
MSTGFVNESAEEKTVRLVYENLLQAWNHADAKAFAGLFARDGNMIGFDGSQANGREEIEAHLSGVFSHHKTGSFVSIVKEIRFITPDIAILRAMAGMVPAGQKDLKPELNVVQSAVIHKDESKYRVGLFQNTPAAFHGRPEDVEKLTKELKKQLELAKDV